MIPGWKIGREIRRLWVQLSEVFHRRTGRLRRIYYDRTLRPQTVITEGLQPLSRDVAILLIYQPNGLLDSLLHELDHFAAKGVSVIVVSNAPLGTDGRRSLIERSHLVIERPNFGYDFGGYRDGILTMLDRGIRPENLFVLNDSMWFPVRPDCDLIDRARASEADVFGIFYNPKSRSAKHWHLQSYFYRFGERLVASPVFADYWRTIPLYNVKGIVIRQFELKLTGWLRSQGFSVESLYTPQSIVEATLALDDDALWDVVEYHGRGDHKKQQIFAPVAAVRAAGGNWRAKAEQLIADSRYKYYFHDSHPRVLFGKLKAPILKKNRDPNFRNQREWLFRQGMDAGFDEAVRTEARTWDDPPSGPQPSP